MMATIAMITAVLPSTSATTQTSIPMTKVRSLSMKATTPFNTPQQE